MNPKQTENLKIFLSLILTTIILSIWFMVLLDILNPNLIMVLFLLTTMMTIIKEYVKILLEDTSI